MDNRIHLIGGATGVPVGTIIWSMLNKTNPPDGYFLCDGSKIAFDRIDVGNETRYYLTVDNQLHDCTEFCSNIYSKMYVDELVEGTDQYVRRVTLPDLQGKTCVGAVSYGDDGLKLTSGSTFTGMLPFDGYNRGKYSSKTSYNYFPGVWAANGSPGCNGVFTSDGSYEKSAGASSHGGVGALKVNMDLSKLGSTRLNGNALSANERYSNTTDILPSSYICNAFVRIY